MIEMQQPSLASQTSGTRPYYGPAPRRWSTMLGRPRRRPVDGGPKADGLHRDGRGTGLGDAAVTGRDRQCPGGGSSDRDEARLYTTHSNKLVNNLTLRLRHS